MELNAIFRNGAVFAADKPIRVFGTGSGHAAVRFLGTEKSVESKGGDWCIELDAQPYGGPYEMEIVLDGVSQLLSDVYVGEVLLLHGQSNIQFRLRDSTYPADLYESCPQLRLYGLQRVSDTEPYCAVDGWVSCTPETAGSFSAIGYHVGLQVAQTRGCAVGLIGCYQGASVIESWLPQGTEASLNIRIADVDRHRDHFKDPYRKWNVEGCLYEKAVRQIMPYALSYVIWYQGESNATVAEGSVYDKLLEALIEQRRRDFDDLSLPFVIIELAECLARAGDGWTLVQKAQNLVSERIRGVTTVPCADVCENDNIHPPTKIHLSKRVANVILGKK